MFIILVSIKLVNKVFREVFCFNYDGYTVLIIFNSASLYGLFILKISVLYMVIAFVVTKEKSIINCRLSVSTQDT